MATFDIQTYSVKKKTKITNFRCICTIYRIKFLGIWYAKTERCYDCAVVSDMSTQWSLLT